MAIPPIGSYTPQATFTKSGKVKQTIYNVRDYGAVGDTKTVSDGVMTTGSGALSSATANFASSDVGKKIMVFGALNRTSGLGGIISSSSSTLVIGAFVAGDIGSSITVNGAGVAGANLTTTVASLMSTPVATAIRLTVAASTTVNSATVTFGAITFTGNMVSGNTQLIITTSFTTLDSCDVGTPIKIPGAGVSGADLVTTVTALGVNSNNATVGNVVTIATPASTSVRNVTLTFGATSGIGTISSFSSSTSVTTSITPFWSVSGATFYWGTDDSSAIGSAITAATPDGVVEIPDMSCFISSPVSMSSGTTLRSTNRYGSYLISGMSPSTNNGILSISNVSDIDIEGLGFVVGGNTTAITSYGHENLSVKNCYLTGPTTADGIIEFSGSGAVANWKDTTIEGCFFYNINNCHRTIHFFPNNGYQQLNTLVKSNRFENTFGPAVMLDAYATLKDTQVIGNQFHNIVGGVPFYEPGVAVYGGIANPYLLFNTVVTDNIYRSTLSPNAQQGFAYIYSAFGTVINDNDMVGAWSSADNVQGPAIAPGRIDNPSIGVTIQGNYIQGFNAPWDPDSCQYADVSGNIVYKCQNSFALGYGIQRYIKIHHNIHYNSVNPVFGAGLQFDNSSPLKCEVTDNTFVDDRPIQAPTVNASLNGGGTLTIGTPYYYVVTSVDEVGETLASSEVTKTPAVVNGVNQQAIRLTWPSISGAISYNIYRSTTSGTYTTPALVTNVIYADYTDTGTAVATGAPPGSSTVAAAVMTYGMIFTGGFNFSDVVVNNNRFYAPHQTLTDIYKQLGTETLPNNLIGNEFQDVNGIAPPILGPLVGTSVTAPQIIGGTLSTSTLTLQATSYGYALLSSGDTVTGSAGTSVIGSGLAALTNGSTSNDTQLKNGAPQSVYLDLGSTNLVSEFRVYLPNPTDPPNAVPASVLISIDNVTYTTVGSIALFNSGGLGWITFTFGPLPARYIQLAFANTGMTYSPHMAQLEAYGWSTVSGLFLTDTALGMGNVPTAGLDAPASTTTQASLRLRSGTAPTSPNSGDMWFDGTHLQFRNGGTTDQLDNQFTSVTSLTLNPTSGSPTGLSFSGPSGSITTLTGIDTSGLGNAGLTATSATQLYIGNLAGTISTNNIGIDIASLTMSGNTDNIGLRIAAPSGATVNYAVLLSDTGGTLTGGITFGTDTYLFRSASGVLSIGALPKFAGTNTTGSGTALLGANSPAVTNTAPYTWIEAVSSDGSTVYLPAWK